MNPTAPVLMVLLVVASVVAPVAAAENEPPLVDAGLDQRVAEGSVVFLDGGGAVDPDGEIVSYEWSIETPRGETIRPQEPTAMLTRFEPERVGRYRVTLVATDDDGATGQDTLYVDVAVSVGEGGGGPDAGNPGDGGGAPSINPPSDVLPAASGSDAVKAGNRPPVGQILGPDEVYAGETRRFVIQASDVDGRVVDYWWLKGAITGGDSLQFEPHRSGKSYTFDLEPGAVAEITAMVKDDDGARTRVSKEVRVLNNPPTVRIIGPDQVDKGSVHRYEAVASDSDSSIASFEWSIPGTHTTFWSPETEYNSFKLGARMGRPGPDSNARHQWFQFVEIPTEDATSRIVVAVRDEHGARQVATKEIVVAKTDSVDIPGRLKNSSPEILSMDGYRTGISTESVFDTYYHKNPGQVTFTAKAFDPDSESLTYHWSFGGEGYATTVDNPDPYSSSEVTFLFSRIDDPKKSFEIFLTVRDGSGLRTTITRELVLTPSTNPPYTPGGSIQLTQDTGPYSANISGVVTIPNTDDEDPSNVVLRFGDGSDQVFQTDPDQQRGQFLFDFHHRYQRSGKYTLYLVDSNVNGVSLGHRTIRVHVKTFREWHFQEVDALVKTTVSHSKPDAGWKKIGVDHYDRIPIDEKRLEIPLVGNSKSHSLGSEWERTRTTTKSTSSFDYIESTESPGSDWHLYKRHVGSREVVTGWRSILVDRKSLAQPDWEYVEKVTRTELEKQTKIGTKRPAGSKWKLVEATGNRRVVGYESEWVHARYLAEPTWRYIRSSRYVSGYRVNRECTQRLRFYSDSYCIRWETTRTPVWDIRYLYKRPIFKKTYVWERTEEVTTSKYRYRYPIYGEVDLHLYRKNIVQEQMYAVWEKKIYAEIPVYSWKFIGQNADYTSSLTKPNPNTSKNVTLHVHQCDSGTGTLEDEACEGGEP